MSRDGKHNTILLLSKEPFVRGPFRFVCSYHKDKAEGRVIYNEAMEGFLYAVLIPGRKECQVIEQERDRRTT